MFQAICSCRLVVKTFDDWMNSMWSVSTV